MFYRVRAYLLLVSLLTSAFLFSAQAVINVSPPCALNSTNRTVTICTPGSPPPGSSTTLSLPMHVVGSSTDSATVTSSAVLIDGAVVYTTSGNKVDVYLSNVAVGPHTLTVQASDSAGTFNNSIPIAITNNAGLTNIRHIIFLVQENHSFDNYYGMLGQYRASKGLPNDIDGVPTGVVLYNSKGQPVSPYHFKTVCTETVSPYWDQDWISVDGGKMDGYLKTGPYTTIDPSGTRLMGYYDQSDLPYYYELATQFATSDRFFSSVESGTTPNRMYLFAGTSFGHVASDLPPNPPGYWTQPTIFDNLDKAGVSWRYYYQDKSSYLPQWSTYQRDASKLVPIANYYTDIQNEATLPSVIYIEHADQIGLDEHPKYNIQKGAARAAQIINALMKSPSWQSSVFIVTYDESGRFYDHVIPPTMVAPDSIPPMIKSGEPQGTFGYAGLRMPVTIVSPWVKPNYVSHTWRDLTSILRLIEVRFNVPSLTLRDAYADDMMEFFDFSSPHWSTPPPLPAQPICGSSTCCSYNLERAPGY